MRLEEEIQACFDKYPQIFQKRWQVLNQLFCVIGNGYEWVNGELVYESTSKLKNNIKLGEDGKAVQRIKVDQHPAYKKLALFKIKWYPLCRKYSKLYNYPDDVKPDWLAGIEETKQLLEADGINWRDVE